MKNLYNKGRYRCHEYGKIPSDLRRAGNRLWRLHAKKEIENMLQENISGLGPVMRRCGKPRRNLVLKIQTINRGFKKSSWHRYRNWRDAGQSIRRNAVVNVFVVRE